MSSITRRNLLSSGLALSASSLLDRFSRPPAFAAPAQSAAAIAPREQLLFDVGWKFTFGHGSDPAKDLGFGFGQADFSKTGDFQTAKPGFDDSHWRNLNLPHDWAVELPFVHDDSSNGGDSALTGHGYKPLGRRFPETSVGWYRREFDIPAGDLGRRIWVEFDGAFRDALVWVNGCFVGRNDNGYAGFRFDLSDFLAYGKRNCILVRVDASFGDGWFYEGAGIYRHVWLTKTDAVHLGKWDSLVRTTVLLLDEPTNHLDVAGIEFLEGWLVERKTGAGLSALVASHDRRFLDAVADRIVEVAHGRLEDYPGDYATYRKLKTERERLRAKEAEKQRQMIERTEEFIRRNIAGQKTKQARSRRTMLARIERIEAPREDGNDVSIRFEEARVSGGRVLEAKKLVPGYKETGPLLQPVSFLLRRGDRLALWGPNGCGKTTLLKTLARVLPPLSGSAVPGTGVLTGYYDQEMGDLPVEATALDAVMDLDPTMKENEARDFRS